MDISEARDRSIPPSEHIALEWGIICLRRLRRLYLSPLKDY